MEISMKNFILALILSAAVGSIAYAESAVPDSVLSTLTAKGVVVSTSTATASCGGSGCQTITNQSSCTGSNCTGTTFANGKTTITTSTNGRLSIGASFHH
jgi:hypothetical protein